MNEIVFIPLLMIGDYYLTLFANFLRQKGHSNHFIIKDYELNPIWLNDIRKGRKVNPKHLAMVLIVTAYFYYLKNTTIDFFLYQILIGFFFTYYLLIIFRHISNVLTYTFVMNNPDQLSGEIVQKPKYIYYHSSYQYLLSLAPLLALLIFIKSYYLYGGALACISMIASHLFMYRRYVNKKEAQGH